MDIRPETQRSPRTTANSGLTLFELLITLSIIAILAGIVAPGLHTLIMNNRMTTRFDELFTAVQGTRSQAIARRQQVVLCPSADQATCLDSSAWQTGWLMFADRNGNKQFDTNETLLRAYRAGDAGLSIASNSGRQRIAMQADGSTAGSNATLTFCDQRGAQQARAIIIALNGRPRAARTHSDGSALICP